MNRTPRLSLPLMHSGQSQKEITHNEALILLDVLINPIVQAIGVETVPKNPKVGQLFIIGAKASGDFANHQKKIAQKLEHSWRYIMPSRWMQVTMDKSGEKYQFDGKNWLPEKQPYLIKQLNGEYLRIGHLQEDIKLAGKETASNIKIPHHTIAIAVNVRVMSKIIGTDTFSIGIDDYQNRYGNKIKGAKNSTNIGMTGQLITTWEDTAINLTADKDQFSGGVVRLTIQYLQPHGPWDWN